jgi:hypothetical protein
MRSGAQLPTIKSSKSAIFPILEPRYAIFEPFQCDFPGQIRYAKPKPSSVLPSKFSPSSGLGRYRAQRRGELAMVAIACFWGLPEGEGGGNDVQGEQGCASPTCYSCCFLLPRPFGPSVSGARLARLLPHWTQTLLDLESRNGKD